MTLSTDVIVTESPLELGIHISTFLMIF